MKTIARITMLSAGIFFLSGDCWARDLRLIHQPGDLIPLPESAASSPPTLVPVTSFRSGSFSHPISAANGDLIIDGVVDGRALGLPQSVRAFWVRRINGLLEPIVRSGMPAPDGLGTLTNIYIDYFYFTPAGRVVFLASRDNRLSWWCKSGDQLRLIAEIGMTINDPAIGEVTLNSLSQSYLTFRQPFDTPEGCGMLFNGSITETTTQTVRESAIVRATTQAHSILVRGTDAPILPLGDPSTVLDTLSFAQSNIRGDLLIGVQLSGPNVVSQNDRAIIFFRDRGETELLAREGAPAPGQSFGGIDTLQWGNTFFTPQLNAAGQIVYRASFRNPDLTTFFAFWSNRSGAGQIIFKQNDPVFGAGTDVAPSLNVARQYYLFDDGSVGFWGAVNDPLDGAFIVDRGSRLDLVARNGMPLSAESPNYKISNTAFNADSFGIVRGAVLASNIVNGRTEFAIMTFAGLGGAGTDKIIYRTRGSLAERVFTYETPFSPEGDVAVSPTIGFPQLQMDEQGNLAFQATVRRVGGSSEYTQSLVTIDAQGNGDLAFANGSTAIPGDTICAAPNSSSPCPALIGSYIPTPNSDRMRTVSSVDVTGDSQPDTGRLYVNLLLNEPSSVARIFSVRLGCRSDINESGALTVQDIFDYLTRYFVKLGDINGQSDTTVQDLFSFLMSYFNGC